MVSNRKFVLLAAVVSLLMCDLSWAAAARSSSGRTLYRYVDANGTTVVKDYLPPEVVSKGYTILNESMQVLEVVPPVKTREQLLAEKRERQQREKEERERREAAKRDAELLRQFTHVEDIMRARDTQLGAIDVQISIRTGQSALLTSQLEEIQKHAADYERRGQPVPAELVRNIQESQRQLAENRNFVDTQNKEKERVADKFKGDIIRFKELQAQRVLKNRDDEGRVTAANTTSYSCPDQEQCKKVWQLAQLYARENATRSLEIVTDTLILSGKPLNERDLAIAFSKVPDRDAGAQIILEISCANNEAGQALCEGERGKKIVDGFSNYVDSRLR